MRKEDRVGYEISGGEKKQRRLSQLEQVEMNRNLKFANDKPEGGIEALGGLLTEWSIGRDFASLDFQNQHKAIIQKGLLGLHYHFRTSFYSAKLNVIKRIMTSTQHKPEFVCLMNFRLTTPFDYPYEALTDIFALNQQEQMRAMKEGVNGGLHDILSDFQNKDVSLVRFRDSILRGDSEKSMSKTHLVHSFPTIFEGVSLQVVNAKTEMAQNGILIHPNISFVINPI